MLVGSCVSPHKRANAMTFDQKVQLSLVVGTWVAGLATLLAVMTSLYLARRGERVRLKIWVGVRELLGGDGSPQDECVCFNVTNVGERPVVVNLVGWVVGRGKKRKYCVQTLSGPLTKQYPMELTHGKDAMFTVSLSSTPNWTSDFCARFINDPSGRSLKTLRAQIFTSVGQTVEVKPETGLVDRLRLVTNRAVESGA